MAVEKSESNNSLAPDAEVGASTEAVDLDEGSSKVKFLLGLLRKLVGVKDISAIRLSLPASLMEPESNLEFWNYMDRPDYFISIPDGDTPEERMLRVIRWWYSKDTKWKDQRIKKPYNSVLGERFLCWWDVAADAEEGDLDIAPTESVSLDGEGVTTETAGAGSKRKTLKVTSVTEQISHHPPVSAYYYECKEKGIIGRGVDHIAARFTGTNVKVGPGVQNHGIYITLTSHNNEEYNIQHPWASITGWLSGSPYITVSESAIIACPQTGLKAVLEYKDEPTFGKAKFAIEGKVFRYDYDADKKFTEKERKEREKLSKIPAADVVCKLHGQWNGKIYVTSAPDASNKSTKSTKSDTSSSRKSSSSLSSAASTDARLLFDMHASSPAVKQTLPIAQQHPLESRRMWEAVTTALLQKESQAATAAKRKLEDEQRTLAAERAAKEAGKHEFESWFFEFKGDRDARPGPPVDMDRAKPYLRKGREPEFGVLDRS
ncbi:uncharacterized protein EV422DRAFT_165296 [Fimicolochytrium jonesii]|uniref:uncharacterized protein n=1 Tax=Fimicolochytrium jonesii TaxID=1396493 RepID=UPI0022FE8DF6|nr:uncharacterized protein EV422DRAFT_165296 [Fimicolochytrium jonesii]KAI8818798.1 hypothetical protein EV422DRAFT_165296 [Fimicolochytrium jonesii]